jgi:hypothetical protein
MHLNTKNNHDDKSDQINFQKLTLPTGDVKHIPDDITIEFPKQAEVTLERLRLLAFVPWDDSFEEHIPVQYRYFFTFAMPYLGARTTNVHTAVAVSFIPELMRSIGKPDDELLLYLAVVLLDCGWSMVSQSEIADSLDYKGIDYTPIAAHAKTKHSIYGAALAFRLLDEYSFEQPLDLAQKELVSDIVRFHESPWRYNSSTESMPRELVITCEADRLWPFTHEGFWLDTIRKDVEPLQYLESCEKAVKEMLLTESGKQIAERLIADRRAEVHVHDNFPKKVSFI